mgnify:CR=1 FL=1
MKRKIILGFLFFGIVLFFSCTQEALFEEHLDNITITQLNESHFVSIDEALQIAELQKNPYAKGLEISDYLEFKKYSDLAEFYIINYPNSGFIIISAEDRLNPILAYSEKSHFPLCDSNVPWGVTDWLNTTSALIDSIRRTNQDQNIVAKYNWNSVLAGKFPVFETNCSSSKTDYSSYVWEYGEDYDQDDCGMDGQVIAEYYIYVPQLLNTTWGQADGYNEQIAYGGCSPTPVNGRYLVGCVAVAVGQIMLENRYPTSGFDWDAIYNGGNAYGTATNAFLKDLGLPGNLNMSYGCTASLAYDSNAISYLISVGYTYTSSTSSISPTTILNDLRFGYPVILSGQGSYGRHMWVCDGIKSYHKIVCFAAGGSYDTGDAINMDKQYLRMNWGWYGSYDGWYSLYNFNPGIYTFNTSRLLIYNIKH